MPETEKRPVRLCDSCGQVDDHPRHVFNAGPGGGETSPEIAAKAISAAGSDASVVAAQIQDTATLSKHFDCCAADGCPDKGVPGLLSCDDLREGAENKKGAALVKHLTSREG